MPGKVREVTAEVSKTCEDALDDDGYVLTDLNPSVAGNVKKATNSDYQPYGIAAHDTVNPITNSAESGKKVRVIKAGWVYVKLEAANSAITRGLYVGTGATTSGVADLLTPNTTDAASLLASLKRIIGRAEEAKAASAGGKILVYLMLR